MLIRNPNTLVYNNHAKGRRKSSIQLVPTPKRELSYPSIPLIHPTLNNKFVVLSPGRTGG